MLFFESYNVTKAICQKYNIDNYTINPDGSVDVDENVNLQFCNLDRLPLKFGKVTRHFDCYGNQLTTLEGAPQSVGGSVDCSDNKLTTLKGAPKFVGVNFYCNYNPLDPIRILFPDDKTFYKLCMEWEFFAGGNKIYKHRFLEAMLDIGKELPESISGYEYI